MCHHNIPIENYDEAVIEEIREEHDEEELREEFTDEQLEELGVSA
ncbi:hypothetical protein [Natronomonas halophila]|nr:hypothetical protein [Natronomonas halophila]